MPVTVTYIAAAAGAGCRGTVHVGGWLRGDWGETGGKGNHPQLGPSP